MIRLIVFDLDGTLVDSSRDLTDAANQLAAAYGGHALTVEAVVGMVGEGVRRLVERVIAVSGASASLDEALARFREIYATCQLVHTRPYPGVPETLAALHARYPLAVLTNKPEASARAVMGGLGLLRWCPRVIGGDGEWPRKPAPEALLHLAAEARVEPTETLMVGDSTFDLRTARSAGAAVCLVRYGFGFSRIAPDEIDGAVWLIDEAADLVARLDEEAARSHVEAGAGEGPAS